MGEWHEHQTIGLLPARAARQWGAREALAFQGQRWTFAELSARVDATAKGLLQLGIAPGDKVALWMVSPPARRDPFSMHSPMRGRVDAPSQGDGFAQHPAGACPPRLGAKP